MPEAAAQGLALGGPGAQRLGAMEEEHAAGAAVRITAVSELHLVPVGLVAEWQRVGDLLQLRWQATGVLVGLLADAHQRDALRLRLDDAHGLAPVEQHVVAGASSGRDFPQHHAVGGEEVGLLVELDDPSCGHQLGVNQEAGLLFGLHTSSLSRLTSGRRRI